MMFKVIKENSNFRKLIAALFISELGSWFTYMLLIVLSYEKTKSILSTMGIIGFSSIGGLIGGAIAGVLIEKRKPQGVIVATNVLSVLLLVSVFFLPTHFAIYYIVAFFIALIGSFRNPAMNKFLVMVVEKDNLAEANSSFQLTREIIKIIGPALAVATLAALPESKQNIGFLIDASTYALGALIILSAINLKPVANNESNTNTKDEKKESFKEMWIEGLQPFKIPIVSSVLIMYFFIILGIGGVDVTLTAYVHESGNPTLFVGYIIGSISLGIIISSMLAAKLIKKLPLSFRLGGVALFIGIFYMGIGITSNIIIMMISAFILGFFTAIYNISASTFWQQTIPFDQIGRFFSIVTSVFSAITLLGMLINGIVAELSSPKFVIIISGLLIAFISLFGMIRISNAEKVDKKEKSALSV